MEQVLPGTDPRDPDRDPIIESTELRDGGDIAGARRILQGLLEADLRCLDAHAHLAHLVFDHGPAEALRHFEVGVRIGELSLPEGFEGVLRWACVDNRPFFRCLHGYGLCLWRLDRRDVASRVFERMLWMNPSDNQGIRSLLPPVRAGERWESDGGDASEIELFRGPSAAPADRRATGSRPERREGRLVTAPRLLVRRPSRRPDGV